MESSSTYSSYLRSIRSALRLRGPAANDPRASTLNALMWGLLLLFTIHGAIGILLTTGGMGLVLFINGVLVLTPVASLILLRNDLVRTAGVVYLAGAWLSYTLIIFFNGGIHHVGLAVYIALPVSAAWLFGYRTALWTAAACLGSATTMAVLETIGIGPLHVFQGRPIGIWLLLLESTVMGVVPVSVVLSNLRWALTQSRKAEAELKENQQHLEDLVQQRTAELTEARDQAQAANQAKSAFLANMSHELRTPLNAILGFSNLLRDDPDISEAHRHDLEIVNRSGEHLLSLIDDVLDVAKIEAGRVNVEKAPFDLHNLVREIGEMMRPRADEKNLKLTLRISGSVPRFVLSDPAKLRQVLINLIGNAVKYTFEGGVTISADASLEDAVDAGSLVITIADTGIGIAPKDQARIFDPFVQAGKNGDQQGTGLGLAITRKFVELMGGTVTVESTSGQGSIFRVDLPVERAENSEMTEAEGDHWRVIGLAPGQPEYRVLIVEDQRENWLVLQRILVGAGFQVRVAENSQQATYASKIWRPQFIWMDLRLPGESGVEAVRQIRQMDGGREAKIVVLTASAFSNQKDQVLAAGVDDFLRKPYRTEEIFDCMARHLGVRYRYRIDSPATGPDLSLHPEALAALPENLRKELAEALIRLEIGRIAEVIGRVSELDRPLGGVLRRNAETFAYTEILSALESGFENSIARGV